MLGGWMVRYNGRDYPWTLTREQMKGPFIEALTERSFSGQQWEPRYSVTAVTGDSVRIVAPSVGHFVLVLPSPDRGQLLFVSEHDRFMGAKMELIGHLFRP